MGRPSIFKPEYCELVEQWGKQGKSKAEMCSLLNIGRATMHDWEREHSHFAASIARAREHSQSWWEAHAQKHLKSKQYQAQLWRYSMAGRFKEDYAEARQLDVTVSLEGLVSALEQREPKVVEGTATTIDPLAMVPKRG